MGWFSSLQSAVLSLLSEFCLLYSVFCVLYSIKLYVIYILNLIASFVK